MAFKVLGLKSAMGTLKAFENMIKQNQKEGTKQIAMLMEGEVKSSISGKRAEQKSVDTGRFLNSVKGKVVNGTTAVIFSAVDYAADLEYGTTKMEGRLHFRNSLSRNEYKFPSFFK